MKLGARMLDPNSTLNNLKYMNQLSVSPGSTMTVMFQLVDLNTIQEANRFGNRYMPDDGAGLTVNITSVVDANSLEKTASQPFADDKSIWQFTLSALETSDLSGTNMKLTLTEGLDISIGIAKQVLIAEPADGSLC